MACVDLGSVCHHQPPPIAVRPAQRHYAGQPLKGHSAARKRSASTVSNARKNPMASTPNISPSARLEDYDLIECVDLTTSLPTQALDLFREPAPGFGSTENDQGNVHCSCCRWAFNDDNRIPRRLGPLSWPVTRRTTNPSYPSRKCCVMLERLTVPLNIPTPSTATTLPLPERHKAETSVGRRTATAESRAAAAAQHLWSRAGSRVPPTSQQLLY